MLCVAPLSYAAQALNTKAVDTRLKVLDGLVALEPRRVPVLNNTAFKSKVAAVAAIMCCVASVHIVVSIGEDIQEWEVGVLMMTDRTEAIDILMAGNARALSIGIACLGRIVCTVATHLCNNIYLLATRHE